jgi:putative FmdB family regulatory protein
MPTYEYECTSCGHRFEEFQGIMDKPIRTCPRCGKEVKRLISGGAGLIFKGSGFYITDYRSESYKKREKEERKTHSEIKNKDVVPKPAKKDS